MTADERAERWRSLYPDLPASAPALLEDLIDEIIRWNRRIRLTAPAPRDELALRIVDDSLLLAPFVRGPILVDVGSGPGVPGLPLAIAIPSLEVRTVEATAKKVAFTRAFLGRHPELKVRPFHGRAEGRAGEAWSGVDTAVSRALTAPRDWIPIGASLLREGGRLLVTLGIGDGAQGDEIAAKNGLSFGGFQAGKVGETTRSVRWYERR